MTSAARPRVLLVEDDASLQRFVALALDTVPIELLTCGSVDAALALLAQQPVQLILTDLMMPGRSGFDLIQALQAQPALRGQARLAVFSAGLTPKVQQRLEGLQVWRLLSKPCSIAELEACVREGARVGEDDAPTAAPAPAQDPSADAIARHFGGNAALYLAFRASCLQQFAADLVAGDQACARADGPALHRLAHSLKSVLLTLGHAEASTQARQLEDLAAHLPAQPDPTAAWPALRARWVDLRTAMGALR